MRREELTEEQRLQAIAYLQRWEVFRQQRELYADMVEKILKDRIRIRCLVTIVKMSQVFPVCLENIEVWQKRVREKMMRMFVAFKAKVRFRLRFERKYGKD